MQKIIYTIGHSTRTLEQLISLLEKNEIELLADVRSYPGSKRYPHFNKVNLSQDLQNHHIIYTHISLLGGRRKVSAESKNIAWKNDAFRGYADYMETDLFKKGIEELTDLAAKYKTVFMCSEAVWWRCHRSMISDYLKAAGWKVMHIMSETKLEEHPYTAPAQIVEGKLCYISKHQSLF